MSFIGPTLVYALFMLLNIYFSYLKIKSAYRNGVIDGRLIGLYRDSNNIKTAPSLQRAWKIVDQYKAEYMRESVLNKESK